MNTGNRFMFSLTIKALAALLDNYNSLWITTDEPNLRTRIVTGILGDGTPQGTQLQIIDPENRYSYTESFSQFAQKYQDATNREIAVRDDAHWHNQQSPHSLLKQSFSFTRLTHELGINGCF